MTQANQNPLKADNIENQETDDSYESIREKLVDAETPGFQAEFDPGEAEHAGAFEEDALSETDALESCIDLDDEG